jgi:hypothetical protein
MGASLASAGFAVDSAGVARGTGGVEVGTRGVEVDTRGFTEGTRGVTEGTAGSDRESAGHSQLQLPVSWTSGMHALVPSASTQQCRVTLEQSALDVHPPAPPCSVQMPCGLLGSPTHA